MLIEKGKSIADFPFLVCCYIMLIYKAFTTICILLVTLRLNVNDTNVGLKNLALLQKHFQNGLTAFHTSIVNGVVCDFGNALF